MDFTQTALEKLTRERMEKPKSKKGCAVISAVADALMEFVRQDDEFAQAVAQSDKTLADCCDEIMRGTGQSISDMEVYRRAVAAYFPGAGIEMQMTINLCASAEGSAGTMDSADHSGTVGKNKAKIVLDLADFL